MSSTHGPLRNSRETAARQPQNSRNTPCDTRKTGAKQRETSARHPDPRIRRACSWEPTAALDLSNYIRHRTEHDRIHVRRPDGDRATVRAAALECWAHRSTSASCTHHPTTAAKQWRPMGAHRTASRLRRGRPSGNALGAGSVPRKALHACSLRPRKRFQPRVTAGRKRSRMPSIPDASVSLRAFLAASQMVKRKG
eukprot:5249111-Prymnesium_polylepis.1